MGSFEQRVHELTELREAIIRHHQQSLRDAMLESICMFSLHESFTEIQQDLAQALNLSLEEAGSYLLPVSRGVYTDVAEVLKVPGKPNELSV